MIRQRYKKNDAVAATTLAEIDSSTSVYNYDATTSGPFNAPQRGGTKTVFDFFSYNYIFHLFSIVIVLIGIRLTFQTLYTHVECDMTWSQRQFIQVDIMFNHSHTNNNYKFYKFIDQRDPRYKHLQKKSVLYANDSSTNWCSSSSSNIVLYVPGHGGSYQQSRSIGAHGIQLTHQNIDRRTQQTLLQRLSFHQQQQQRDIEHSFNGNATKSRATTFDDFFFDVYAFDFNEEGGAFHGKILERQATYIVNVISKLTEVCRRIEKEKNEFLPIHIVAHSIGGISTRVALQQLQQLNHTNNVAVQNVITLGTPHYMPVWNWGTSIHNLYNQLYSNNPSSSNTTIISISGGLRDEMIPPRACYLDDHDDQKMKSNVHPLSVFTADIMIPASIEAKDYVPPYIGMDHRAIVWCHNVLSQVRYILYTLIHTPSNSLSETSPESNNPKIAKDHELHRKLQNESSDYLQSLSNLQQSLKTKYGWYTAFVMETSLLYNTEILVNLFTILGIVRYLRLDNFGGSKMVSSIVSTTYPPILCTILYYCMSFGVKRKHTVPSLSILILAFVADAIFITTKFVLRTYLQGALKMRNASVFSVATPIFIFTSLSWLVLYFVLGQKSWFRVEFVAVVTTIALVVELSMLLVTVIPKGQPTQQAFALYYERQLNYVVLLLWMLPPTIIGEVYAIFKGIHAWGVHMILFTILVRLVLTIYSVLWVKSCSKPPSTPMSKKEIALQVCCFTMLPLCCWRLLTLDVYDQILLHPLPMVLLVATSCDAMESLIM